jgi:glycosyltransferase involved in cell wall biosynthesis
MKISHKISIITITKDDLAGLERTASSLSRLINLSLDMEISFEWLIQDANSRFSIDDFMANIDPNLLPSLSYVREGDKGIYDGMNKAIRRSSGEALIFMNSGDIFIEDGFLALIKTYNYMPDICFLYGVDLSQRRGGLISILSYFLGDCYLPLPSHQSMLISSLYQKKNIYDYCSFPISADKSLKIQAMKSLKDYHFVNVAVCRTEPGGMSVIFPSFDTIVKRSIEQFLVYRLHHMSIYGVIYSIYYFLKNFYHFSKKATGKRFD